MESQRISPIFGSQAFLDFMASAMAILWLVFLQICWGLPAYLHCWYVECDRALFVGCYEGVLDGLECCFGIFYCVEVVAADCLVECGVPGTPVGIAEVPAGWFVHR